MNTADTTAGRLARLDASLAAHGQDVTLQRRVGTSTVFVTVALRARITGYGTADLSAGIKVTDSKFIASPSPIIAAGAAWPGAAGGDQPVKIGDELVVEGRRRRVEQVDNIMIGGAWIRIEGRISG